jgi:predicted amidohydrolase YtcJ
MHADLLLYNGNIRTLDDAGTVAQSVAVLNDRILALGTDSELAPLAGPKTVQLDLDRRTVLPGFIDAHEHLSWLADQYLTVNCAPDEIKSLAQLCAGVQAESKKIGPGEWIRGMRYDDTKMIEGRTLTRRELDAAAPHNPVIIIHISGHWAVVNSEALKRGGLAATSPDPEGGTLGRDRESGELDGRLIETALFDFAFESLARQPTVVPPYPRDARKELVRKAADFLNAAGFCGVGDALCPPSYITTYHDLAKEQALPLRINMMIPYLFLPHLEKLGLTGGWGNEWVRAAGIKMIVDGAISGRTAAMRDGYAHDPQDHGVMVIDSQDVLNDLVQRIHDLGYQACIHANGDMAIEMALNAIERAQRANPRRDARHRIEHCTMINDGILQRMVRLKVMALPFTSYLWQHGEKLRPFYGRRADRMFAHKSFLNAGVMVAAGSDHPVGLHSALLGVQCMVTRRASTGEVIGPDERLSLEEAFKVYTVYAAHASCEEHIKGCLTPRRLADLVVLNRDPWDTVPDELSGIDVDMTIVGGRIVYRRV